MDKILTKDMKTLDGYRNISTNLVFGTSLSDRAENKEIENDINGLVDKMRGNFKSSINTDVIEFFNTVRNNGTVIDKTTKKPVVKDVNKDLSKLENNLNLVNDLFYEEKSRIERYRQYELLYYNITQLSQSVTTFKDNIKSPDDFTKMMFNVFYEDNEFSGKVTDLNNIVLNNIDHLITKYKLEAITDGVINKSLYKGDYFLAVLNIGKEMRSILTENLNVDEEVTKDLLLKESLLEGVKEIKGNDVFIENALLDIYYEENEIDKKEIDTNKDIEALKNVVKTMVNENIELYDGTKSLLVENIITNAEIKEDDFFNKNDDFKDFKMSGSILKGFEPEDICKLGKDGFTYGYIAIEKEDKYMKSFGDKKSQDMNNMMQNAMEVNGISVMNIDERDPHGGRYSSKIKLIQNMFLKNISTKMDKDFITQNKEFKEMIYYLLKEKYIINKKVRIHFIPASEMIHFRPNESLDEYGDSLFKPILFIAKMYLANLVSNLMKQISRANDKRAFYVKADAGDNNIESTIQSFMREIKTKSITMNNLKDVDTIMRRIGTFDDYFIPVINGEKPVELDTIPGMDVQIDNDFMDFLRKAMMSGIGIPPDFLSYTDAEFSRSLAMQNGKFIRDIIVKQKVYAQAFSTLVRKLYKNEFMKEEDIADTSYVNMNTLDTEHLSDSNFASTQLEINNRKKGLNKDINYANRIVRESLNSILNVFSTENNHRKKNKKINGVINEMTSNLENVNLKESTNESDITEKATVNLAKVNLNAIRVEFPIPSSLNSVNTAEQIRNSEEIVRFVVNTLVGENSQDEKLKTELTKEVTKKYVASIDWADMEDILEKCKVNVVTDKLKPKVEGEVEDYGY